MEIEVYERMAAEQEKHWWFRARREILSFLLKQLEPGDNARILEIGCGTGGNLRMLTTFGDVSAVEKDKNAREFARELTGINVLEGELPGALKEFDSKFDLICLFDVLEHIDEDIEAMVRVKELLSNEGSIIMTVPAYQWLYGTHDREHHHFRRYIKSDIAQLSSKAGLEVSKISYFNTLLFPIVVLARMVDKFRDHDRSIGSAVPMGIINELLYQVFRLEKILLKYTVLPYGASIYSVLKKA